MRKILLVFSTVLMFNAMSMAQHLPYSPKSKKNSSIEIGIKGGKAYSYLRFDDYGIANTDFISGIFLTKSFKNAKPKLQIELSHQIKTVPKIETVIIPHVPFPPETIITNKMYRYFSMPLLFVVPFEELGLDVYVGMELDYISPVTDAGNIEKFMAGYLMGTTINITDRTKFDFRLMLSATKFYPDIRQNYKYFAITIQHQLFELK